LIKLRDSDTFSLINLDH